MNQKSDDKESQGNKESDAEEIELNILFEQYKLYVEMADHISERRDHMNKFYTSVLSITLALTTFIFNYEIVQLSQFSVFILSLLGLLLCTLWYLNIEQYRKLNSAKFKVINEIESYLPYAGYNREYEHLTADSKYRPLSKTEQKVPFILAIPFLFLLFSSFKDLICN